MHAVKLHPGAHPPPLSSSSPPPSPLILFSYLLPPHPLLLPSPPSPFSPLSSLAAPPPCFAPLPAALSRRDPGYWSTSRMLLECGLALALEGPACPKAAGILTPATAMGAVLLQRLRSAGFVFDVVID